MLASRSCFTRSQLVDGLGSSSGERLGHFASDDDRDEGQGLGLCSSRSEEHSGCLVGWVLGERPRIAKREASMDDRLIDGRGGTMTFSL